MNYSRLETQIMQDEGFRSEVYRDGGGVWTIGYGTTRLFGIRVTEQTSDLLEPIAREILRADLFKALINAQAVINNWSEQNSVRQEVLANMAYNLGRSGLAGFKKMILALEFNDHDHAAAEMKDSKWYRQVGDRGVRLVAHMRNGT